MQEGYIPKTSTFGIIGTSYAIQLGEFDGNLASIIYRGKEVIAFNCFKSVFIISIIVLKKATLKSLNLNFLNTYLRLVFIYALFLIKFAFAFMINSNDS